MIGVYILKNNKGKIIYIGKSTDIKNRVNSHLKSSNFAGKIYKADYIETQNEAGALIKESELIKKYKPRYNIMLRDDKQYFYVEFTQNKLPILKVTHQPTTSPPIPLSLIPPRADPPRVERRGVGGEVAGPFTDGKSLKTVLKYLRKAFPYYTQVHRKLPCSYCHLDLCPGPPPKETLGETRPSLMGGDPFVKEYKKNISKIKLILNGKSPRVISALKKEMARFAKNLDFEKAAKAKNQISALENIFSHRKWNSIDFERVVSLRRTPERAQSASEKSEKSMLFQYPRSLEAYDISNIQGKEPVASMVRFDNGKPNKSLYRKFKIRLRDVPNDTAMIKEVIRRRLAHPEWPYPDLFLIDGGRGQLNAALRQCQMSNVKCQTTALAKKFNELYIPNRRNPIPLDSLPQRTKNLLMYARDEAHRFAISYHRKLHRKKSML